MAAKKTLVALNIGSQRVTMGVFAPGKGSLVLRRYDSAELLADPSTDATRSAQVRAAVEELAAKLKVKGEFTRYCVSGRSAFMRFVKLPPLDVEKVDQIVEFEAQQNVPFPIDEVVWDYQLIGEDQSSEVEVVIIAVKSEVLDEVNDAVEASVRAESVDAAPMALYNAFRFNYGDVAEPSLLIDIGARSTNLIFAEGDRVFARNSTSVGGSTISQAIAKEFEADFSTAEQRKVEDGLVNLGGAYEDPQDPEIAAISKVIRNTLTRLHADIVRTMNQYRGQQGGAAPERVYLAGGSAGLGYIKEFFEDKLKLPVEFFNPLRSVGIGPNVDAERAAAEAHRLGEIVGLALRGAGACPMEIDLVPEAVARSRNVAARRPYLMMAAAVVLGLFGAGISYFKRADAVAQEELRVMEAQKDELSGWDRKIQDVVASLEADKERGRQLGDAVIDRSHWSDMLSDMNNRLPDDQVWLTVVEPIAGTAYLTASGASEISGTVRDALELFSAEGGEGGNNQPAQRPADAPPPPITMVHVQGLYRSEGGRSGPGSVEAFLDNLAESPFFDIQDLEFERPKYMPRLIVQGGGGQWAYPFDFILPLKRPLPVQ